MDFLSDLDPEVIALLSDSDFEEGVKREARSLAGDALNTYREVALEGEDEKARVLAADRLLSLGGIDDSSQSSLPSGVSEEVFKIALAGLVSLGKIAQSSPSSPLILRDVTPARSDPRFAETSELSLPAPTPPVIENPPSLPKEHSLVAKERYEIRDRQLYEDE